MFDKERLHGGEHHHDTLIEYTREIASISSFAKNWPARGYRIRYLRQWSHIGWLVSESHGTKNKIMSSMD